MKNFFVTFFINDCKQCVSKFVTQVCLVFVVDSTVWPNADL